MKRLVPIAIALALLLTGCTLLRKAEEQQEPLRLYYAYAASDLGPYDGDTGALGYETDPLVPADAAVERVLTRYWDGPKSETLTLPFPETVTLEDWTLEGGCLTLTLHEDAGALIGMDRTITAACLVETLTQLPEVETVVLTTGLEEAAGGLFDTPLTAEDFLLATGSAQEPET